MTAAAFEQHRPHARAVAYRMLGAVSDADDAVQEAWLRLSRADAGEIVLRADGGAAKGMSRVVHGAQQVAAQAQAFSTLGLTSHVVLVNGNIGVASRLPNGRVLSVIGYTVAGGKVVAMDILADADRLAKLDLSAVS